MAALLILNNWLPQPCMPQLSPYSNASIEYRPRYTGFHLMRERCPDVTSLDSADKWCWRLHWKLRFTAIIIKFRVQLRKFEAGSTLWTDYFQHQTANVSIKLFAVGFYKQPTYPRQINLNCNSQPLRIELTQIWNRTNQIELTHFSIQVQFKALNCTEHWLKFWKWDPNVGQQNWTAYSHWYRSRRASY